MGRLSRNCGSVKIPDPEGAIQTLHLNMLYCLENYIYFVICYLYTLQHTWHFLSLENEATLFQYATQVVMQSKRISKRYQSRVRKISQYNEPHQNSRRQMGDANKIHTEDPTTSSRLSDSVPVICEPQLVKLT
jgi:hypothetical protein